MARVRAAWGVTFAAVASMHAQGHRSRVIARALDLSEGAVAYHIRRLAPRCPVCGTQLTLGVVHRLQQANRGKGSIYAEG